LGGRGGKKRGKREREGRTGTIMPVSPSPLSQRDDEKKKGKKKRGKKDLKKGGKRDQQQQRISIKLIIYLITV